MFSRFFGKKAEEAPTTNQGIQKLGDTLDVLEKREAVLNKKIEAELGKAREATKKGNKTLAMTHLKRKKQLEDQLSKLSAQRGNIETMQMKMEEATINLETIKAQKDAARALKETYGKMNADKIDAEMEKVREAMDTAQEISDALAQPLTNDALDEDDLEAELAQMEQEELDKEMLGVGGKTAMPSVPTGKIGGHAQPAAAAPAAKVDEDEEALRQLEAELNM
eukprot:EG_transcript_22038